jgi:transcriptional regulator with XRE-family HTH domain
MEQIHSAEELEITLGDNIKRLRLQKNITRQRLCEVAGISQSALRHLEAGEGATIKTLVRIVRALNRQDWLTALAPEVSINPLSLVRNKSVRQRASRQSGGKEKN